MTTPLNPRNPRNSRNPAVTTCPECGAQQGTTTTCSGYFHELLALDLQRGQPYRRYHELNVACYLLQHPSAIAEGRHHHLGTLWQMVTVYLSGGIESVNVLARQRAAGSIPSYDDPPASGSDVPVPPQTKLPSITIRDVAAEDPANPGGGLFPVSGYEDRMHLWVLSIAAERGLGSAA